MSSCAPLALWTAAEPPPLQFNPLLSATVSLAVVYPELLCTNLMYRGMRLEAPA